MQYLDYKKQYPDALLLFQVGDFYELFFSDAVTVARTLNLTLTTRDKNNPDPIPMCGVPVAVVDGYVDRLVAAGYSVAIVSQGALPASGKGMVPRKLERIVTPGINILGSPSTSVAETSVAAIGGDPDRLLSIAFSNVQSGILRTCDGIPPDALASELGKLGITEVILPQVSYNKRVDRRSPWVRLIEGTVGEHGVKFRSLASTDVSGSSARALGTISGFSTLGTPGKQAVRLLIDYIDEITVETKIPIRLIEPWSNASLVAIDAPTRRNLELVTNSHDNGTAGTLFEYLNECRSPAGTRLLHNWILHPSCDLAQIKSRQKAVAKLIPALDARSTIRTRLQSMVDFERLAARIELNAVTPRELGALRDAVVRLPEIKALLSDLERKEETILSALAQQTELSVELGSMLERALMDEPPHMLSEGGIIRDGYNSDLDRLRALNTQGRTWIAELENREKEATGISSLKVRFNNVLGFFIEITKANLSKVPERFIRRQSTANSDRFTTTELAKLAEDVLGAQGKIIDLERKLFEALRAELLQYTAELRRAGEAIASIDILQAFAELAARDDLFAPELDGSRLLVIEKGKHPVVARLLREQFVPNSLELAESGHCCIITGPNMGGKSTFLRQAALIVIMAQLGSFVPAKKALIGIVDKIFARIGASDNVSEGESTFMVEMREAAHIIGSSTGSSLVLIDEVGRGTATADGLAIAQAILEWLVVETKARTLFATHFHELTKLDSSYKGIKNLSVGSIEREDSVIFTHEIQQGAANRSYGIEVAKLAGLPAPLLSRAQELLALETTSSAAVEQRQLSIFSGAESAKSTEPLDYKPLKALAEDLRRIDVQTTTPLEALLLLDKLTGVAAKIR